MANRASTPPKGEGKYNIVVIGAGTAGLVTAAASVGMGARVALIEKGKMGGDCLNFGCVPSKALLRSSKIFGYLRRAEEFGAEIGEIKTDFLKALERMRRLRGKIEPNDSVERFDQSSDGWIACRLDSGNCCEYRVTLLPVGRDEDISSVTTSYSGR